MNYQQHDILKCIIIHFRECKIPKFLKENKLLCISALYYLILEVQFEIIYVPIILSSL